MPDPGYGKDVAVATVQRRGATHPFGWVAENVGRFLATWIAVGSGVAAAVMVTEGEPFSAPVSLEEILFVPPFLVAFAVMSAFVAAVGLFLFAPAWVPGLVLYLAALWWGSRILRSHRRRTAAVAASPLVAVFFFAGGVQIVSLQLAALAGSIVYGCLVRLPP